MEFTHVCSTDAGNGGVNTLAVRAGQNPSRPTYNYFPSVRAVVRGKGLGLGAEQELQFARVDWQGQQYIVGDDVTRISRQGLDKHMGKDRYGGEHHQFLVLTALARCGVGMDAPANVALTLFCPPSYFADQKEAIRKAFEGKSYNFAYAGKPHHIRIGRVFVVPEGQAALFCFNMNPDGTPNDRTPLIGDTLFFDSGVYTLDCVLIQDGKVSPERTFSLADAGIDQFIRKPLMSYAQGAGYDFQNVDENDIDVLLRAFCEAKTEEEQREAAILYYGGYELDLYADLVHHTNRYASWIVANVIARYDGLRGIKHLVLVGGGASLITRQMIELYPDKVKNLENPPHYAVAKIHPVNMNVYGGLRVALAKVGN